MVPNRAAHHKYSLKFILKTNMALNWILFGFEFHSIDSLEQNELITCSEVFLLQVNSQLYAFFLLSSKYCYAKSKKSFRSSLENSLAKLLIYMGALMPEFISSKATNLKGFHYIVDILLEILYHIIHTSQILGIQISSQHLIREQANLLGFFFFFFLSAGLILAIFIR